MNTYIKRISLFAIALIMLFTSFYNAVLVSADSSGVNVRYDYDTSTIIEDLNNGVATDESGFFPERYLANVFGQDNINAVRQGTYDYSQDIYVFNFVETGLDNPDEYGVYLYVYNPKGLTIDFSSAYNKVQLAYTTEKEEVFRATYQKYRLFKKDSTSDGTYIKFKVSGLNVSGGTDRYYAVSGIELRIVLDNEELQKSLIIGSDSVTREYVVGSIYRCTTENGITTIIRENLDTIAVDVTHIYYRTDDSEKGRGWSNQLSACYFSLPKEYSFENNLFGRLSEIKAVFDLYYTKPMLILNNQFVYEDFISAVGADSIRFPNLSFRTSYSRDFNYDPLYTSYNDFYYFGYNFSTSYTYGIYYYSIIDPLYWVLPDINADFDNVDYIFSADKVKAYYDSFNSPLLNNYLYGSLFTKENLLFESEDYFNDNHLSLCGFSYGYNEHTYSISQDPEQGAVLGYNLTFDSNVSFWTSLAEAFGINQTQTVTGIAPLVQVDYADRNMSVDDFSEKYYVAKSQVVDLQKKLREVGLKQEVWIFRYDCSEYYGAKAEVYDKNISNDIYDGLVSQQPVYFNWDILSFTFEQPEILSQALGVRKTTVPVNHDPEDVFNDITRSANDFPRLLGCTDYGSMLKTLGFLGLALSIWFVATKIIRFIKRR
ncbi:MAG: hypothetical protein IJQ66_07400 [Clostridia bacterium]|nr:hypothetical protein [Clostridia bacterium]